MGSLPTALTRRFQFRPLPAVQLIEFVQSYRRLCDL
jgi:hypothetical protein